VLLIDTLRIARRRRGVSLRQLAASAGTSHATLSAYESGRVAPTLGTFARVVGAAGFDADVTLAARVSGVERGDELAQVLDLAGRFPARHAPTLDAPVFGRVPVGPAAR